MSGQGQACSNHGNNHVTEEATQTMSGQGQACSNHGNNQVLLQSQGGQ